MPNRPTANALLLIALTIPFSSFADPGAVATPQANAADAGQASPPKDAAGKGGNPDDKGQKNEDGFKFKPAMMTATDASTGSSADTSTLGLEYSGQKTHACAQGDIVAQLTNWQRGETPSKNPWACFWQLSASGKVAANPDVNVGDLIDFKASFGWERYFFAESKPAAGFDSPAPAPGFGAASPAPDAAKPSGFTGYLTVKGNASFESGQRLSTKNYLYGLSLYAHASPNNVDQDYWYNVFDWPGRLSRMLLMTESEELNTRNQSRSWPAILAELQRVNPDTDDARKAVDPSLANYTRHHVRLSAATLLGKLHDGRELVFNFKVDHWGELSPTDAIKTAKLNHQTYRAFALTAMGLKGDEEWEIKYASGSVPTDQESSKVWQVGWSHKF